LPKRGCRPLESTMQASPPTTRVTRAATAARSRVIDLLQEDHRRIKQAYREFLRLDAQRNGDLCESIVRRTLAELRVHAALEEELLYPLLRPIVTDVEAVDEAEVEHEIVRYLGEQLDASHAVDEKFAARFSVLCEYVLHHVKEEEGELFPQLKRAKLDWEGLLDEFMARRQALQAADGRLDSMVARESGEYVAERGEDSQLPADEHGVLLNGRLAGRPAHYDAGTITSRKI
jgi:hemerythrin superfamily protein